MHAASPHSTSAIVSRPGAYVSGLPTRRLRRIYCRQRQALYRDNLPQDSSSDDDADVVFLTSDGVVRLPAVRCSTKPAQGAGATRIAGRPALPTWQEQGLCIGASFCVAATNGHDPARRVNISGFTGSIDHLFDTVEDTVLSRGGKILQEERRLRSGVHETLHLIVAIPYLWGVPPQLEALSSAITLGGGVVHRVHREWVLYGQTDHFNHTRWGGMPPLKQ